MVKLFSDCVSPIGVFIINLYLYFEKGLVVSVFSERDTFSPFDYFCSFSLTQSVFYQHYFLIFAGVFLILSNDFCGYREILLSIQILLISYLYPKTIQGAIYLFISLPCLLSRMNIISGTPCHLDKKIEHYLM